MDADVIAVIVDSELRRQTQTDHIELSCRLCDEAPLMYFVPEYFVPRGQARYEAIFCHLCELSNTTRLCDIWELIQVLHKQALKETVAMK